MSDSPTASNGNGNGKRRRLLLIIATVFIVAGIAWLSLWWLVFSLREVTDDAYVNGNQVILSSQVPGTVIEILADDTQRVNAGQVLVKLDPTDSDLALAKAQSALAQAVRQVRQQTQMAGQYDAAIAAQRENLARAQAERQLARSEHVKDFMLALFREQDPISRAKAKVRSASQLIGDGIAQIDATLDAEPDLQAELLRDLGEIQINLDDGKAGVATLARAWDMQKRLSGADSLAATEALVAYAGGVYATGDVKAAASLVDAATKRLRELGAARSERMAKWNEGIRIEQAARLPFAARQALRRGPPSSGR